MYQMIDQFCGLKMELWSEAIFISNATSLNLHLNEDVKEIKKFNVLTQLLSLWKVFSFMNDGNLFSQSCSNNWLPFLLISTWSFVFQTFVISLKRLFNDCLIPRQTIIVTLNNGSSEKPNLILLYWAICYQRLSFLSFSPCRSRLKLGD